MGEDQGHYNLLSDEDLNDLISNTLTDRPADLNNNSDFEAPIPPGLSAQASSIPAAASADPLGHPTVSFPSTDACELPGLQCGLAAFNHADVNVSDCLESNETASFAQIAQMPDLDENELFDINDFLRLNSQEPTETASPLQPVQPPRSMEEETSPLVDFDSNSTIVLDGTLDSHSLQQATGNANLLQAPVSAESFLLRSVDLDPGPSTAIPGLAPMSSEQPAMLVDNTMINPAAAPEADSSAMFQYALDTAASEPTSSAMPFNGANLQHALDLASYQDVSSSPSCGMNRTLSIPGELPQSTSGSSLSHRRDYVEIRPKETETTQDTKLSSARGSSNVISPSSEVVLATCAPPPSVKGKRKRLQLFAGTQSGIPEGFTCVFPASNSTAAAAARGGQQKPPTGKRVRSAKACLRCQMQNLGVR